MKLLEAKLNPNFIVYKAKKSKKLRTKGSSPTNCRLAGSKRSTFKIEMNIGKFKDFYQTPFWHTDAQAHFYLTYLTTYRNLKRNFV